MQRRRQNSWINTHHYDTVEVWLLEKQVKKSGPSRQYLQSSISSYELLPTPLSLHRHMKTIGGQSSPTDSVRPGYSFQLKKLPIGANEEKTTKHISNKALNFRHILWSRKPNDCLWRPTDWPIIRNLWVFVASINVSWYWISLKCSSANYQSFDWIPSWLRDQNRKGKTSSVMTIMTRSTYDVNYESKDAIDDYEITDKLFGATAYALDNYTS